ncbi:Acetoin dehydrogenase operon transcriptional activator AcoR [Nocardioides aquaticus]|uniref:Acetoin dehydrogenase operon transcriptional activator AcoR n=1 Tax=Nocardioides aquaticus TaxID=160826 RepID=A0ABX8EPM2_9ACTN|nr:helix-turn-helix domain-containing protein [Nocardioides aquaticus]QVT82015.1 Acetoin dehydrogenase operon transcriptional activator AcoR [Nocardioides aquaticus]
MSLTDEMRAPIADSWRRAGLAGVDPASALQGLTYAEVDLRSPLMAAATPVLDDLGDQLSETVFSTLLVDRDGRVAQRWCGTRGLERAFDDLGVAVGVSMLEEAVGTNAPGTVLETRERIAVHGSEHYAVPLRDFSCYGHPIFHPVTRRIEGVLDITCVATSADPLLRPVVARAVADIEQRLLDGSRVSETELLHAFQAASGRRRAVVAMLDDLTMSNRTALDLLGQVDLTLLRMLAQDVGSTGLSREITLESGVAARVRVEHVPRTRGGSLVHVEPLARPRSPRNRTTPVSRVATGPALVAGAPGTGRTTYAARLAGDHRVAVLTAARALLDGPQAWSRDFASLVRAGQGTVCVDGVDLLPDHLVDLVASHVATATAPRVVLISGPVDDLVGRAAALVSACTDRTELAPLAARTADLPDLVATQLVDLGCDASVHLAPSALAALGAQSWPGNLRELRAVLEHAVRDRGLGPITVDHLPEAYRSRDGARTLAPLERAERDAIVAALDQHGGNKVRAAAALGISRTTLYAKLRTLRITAY